MIAVAGRMWIGGLPSSAAWALLALCVAAAAAGTGAALDTGAALATALQRPAPPAR